MKEFLRHQATICCLKRSIVLAVLGLARRKDSVGFEVSGDLAGLGACVGAVGAFVRLFSGVRSAVDGQVTAVLEHLKKIGNLFSQMKVFSNIRT